MKTTVIKFSDIEIQKQIFYKHKRPTSTKKNRY